MVIEPKVISFPIEDTLVKIYKLRWSLPGPSRKSKGVEVAVPRDFIQGIARRNSLSYEEVVGSFQVAVFYGGGNTLLYKFEKINGNGE